MTKIWIGVAALVIASPASAIPPIAPEPAATEIVQAFIRATTNNDLGAYAKLLSQTATVTTEAGQTMDKAQWIAAVSSEFSPDRRTRFRSVFARYVFSAGRPGTRVLFVEEARGCPPTLIECFAAYRVETITVIDGQIVGLERSNFTHQLTGEDEWDFYD